MLMMTGLLAALATFLSLFLHISAEDYQPLCDLHTVDYGPHTPSTILPVASDDLHTTRTSSSTSSTGLFPSLEDINTHYLAAKQQCEHFLSDAEQVRKAFLSSSDHAPYYPQPITGRGQLKCRGRDTLYSLTGKILWPFGPSITKSLNSKSPHAECSTYSKCWFGLLSCGTWEESRVQKATKDEVEKARKRVTGSNTTFPSNGQGWKWSIKSVAMQLRVVGPEIIVPEQRLVHLNGNSNSASKSSDSSSNNSNSFDDDVIIAQFYVTIPDSNYTIEMRHFEFYPSILMPWNNDAMNYSTHNFGMIYLGASEGRCKPWTKCDITNLCCGCDERTFVLHSPLQLTVDNSGQARCSNELNQPKPTILPLCKIAADFRTNNSEYNNPPGRWIKSNHPTLPKVCRADNSYNIARMNVNSQFQHTKSHLDKLAEEDQKDASKHHGWYEASGNPCIAGDGGEELGSPHWFFAPYTCKYHFYERHEIHQCLRDTGIGHIHFQGDSMSRELFSLVSTFLGVPQVTEANLKHMTNNMNMKEIKFHTGAVLLTEGYSWDFNPSVLQLSEHPPLPNVIITNYALAHRTDHLHIFKKHFEEQEYNYWTVTRNQKLPKPAFLIFQGARELHGRRTNSFDGNIIREASHYAKQRYGTLGFVELEEYPVTAGRYDIYNKHTDGWHFMGTSRQMEVIILFNIICNDWLQTNGSKSN